MPTQRNHHLFTALLAVAFILGLPWGNDNFLGLISKILFVPSLLILYLLRARRAYPGVLLGLLFGLGGDIFLDSSKVHASYFLIGLLAFLIGHLFYIRSFLHLRWHTAGARSRKKTILLLFSFVLVFVYVASLLYTLQSGIETEMMMPVGLYAFVLGCLFFTHMLRWQQTSKISFGFGLLGTSFFILSDSCIALQRFGGGKHHEAIACLILPTYFLAQYFLMRSFLAHPELESQSSSMPTQTL